MALQLSRDDRGSILQVSKYKVDDGIVLADGATTSAYSYNPVLRIVAYDATVWIGISGTAAVGSGLVLPYGSEIHLQLDTGDTLTVAGGPINIVELGN